MAEVGLLLMMAVWGSAFSIMRMCLVGKGTLASPMALLAARMVLACVLLVGGLAAFGTGRRLLARLWSREAFAPRGVVRDGLICGSLLALGFVLQTEGLPRTSASRSGFLTGLLVAFIPLIELGWFRKRPTPPAVVALAITVAGLALLSGSLASGGDTLVGDLLTIGCAIVFAAHVVVLGRVTGRHPVSLLLLLQLVCVGVMALVVGPIVEPTQLTVGPRLSMVIVYLALFPTLLAFGLLTWAQRRVTPVRIAIISSLEPVFAAMIAALLLHERLSRQELSGGSLIVMGVLVGEVGSALWARRPSAALT